MLRLDLGFSASSFVGLSTFRLKSPISRLAVGVEALMEVWVASSSLLLLKTKDIERGWALMASLTICSCSSISNFYGSITWTLNVSSFVSSFSISSTEFTLISFTFGSEVPSSSIASIWASDLTDSSSKAEGSSDAADYSALSACFNNWSSDSPSAGVVAVIEAYLQ